ncbi:MAG: DNA repair protein RecO C-terminal domain-containing protein [SAR324 cluster bacterium]|nr:DNA repair protein RecO C-terminal domain-containing protein [SAR324 cluster bacterium]
MRQIKEPLLLLTKYSYGEADWICHFLSREEGIVSAKLASGQKMGKASTFGYQGGELLEVEYLLEEGKDFIKISNHKGLRSFDPEKLDYDSYLGLSFLLELTHKFGHRGIEPQGLFNLIQNKLSQPWAGEQVPLILVQCLWEFIELSGIGFSLSHCDHCHRENFIKDDEDIKFRKSSYNLRDSEGTLWCQKCSGPGPIDSSLLKALWMLSEKQPLNAIPKELWLRWFPWLLNHLLWHHPMDLKSLEVLPKGLKALRQF